MLFARIAVAIAVNALALWIANILWASVNIHGFWAYLIGAAVLGVADAILKPILAHPDAAVDHHHARAGSCWVINIAMVALAEWIAPNFSIDGFWTYLGVVVVVWLVNLIAYTAIDRAESPRAQTA